MRKKIKKINHNKTKKNSSVKLPISEINLQFERDEPIEIKV